jgi:uncharacterized protein (TIGR03435 family)
MRTPGLLRSFVLLSGFAFGQVAETTPKIELADVHAAPKSSEPRSRMTVPRAGRWELRNVTVLELIGLAYTVDADRVIGGPNWLDSARYDIIAKVPPGTTFETGRPMLKGLLADRFKLVVHDDTKQMPTYVLSVAKGKHKMKEAEGSGPANCNGRPVDPAKGAVLIGVKCQNMTMEVLAQNLRGAGGYVTENIVDKTDLKGTWDFEFQFTARPLLTQAGQDGITLPDALEKQVGLKLELQKNSLPVIVIDSVSETPTDNPPGVVTSIPPPLPSEFEVADIKPSPPGTTTQNARMQNGRLDVEGFPLKQLIMAAFELRSDDFVANMPKWAETSRFNIVAKACADPSNCAQVDDATLLPMVRKLLEDRFKLKTHYEDRMVNAYTLLSVKPKLQKADPTNRTGCREGGTLQGADPRDKTPALSRLITCQNMTMKEFAVQLQRLASGYVKSQVVDATGLEGAWDFTLNFSPIGALQQNGAPRESGATEASETSGALSLPDAISKQLGLKLEMQKRMLPVLVIDHIDEKPTDN